MIETNFPISPKLPSERKFGWFFTSIFAALAAYSHWKQWGGQAFVASSIAICFMAFTIIAPQALASLNRLWFSLGMLLGKIVSPIILGIIFFILITPTSLVMRLFGRDELKIKKRNVESYWIDRQPPGPSSDSFKNQY